MAFLQILLVLPAFLAFAPHEAAHAMHSCHVLHHNESTHHFSQTSHVENHTAHYDEENFHHDMPLDVASYYEEFLHVDLNKVEQGAIISSNNAEPDLTSFFAQTTSSPYERFELASLQARAPPMAQAYTPLESSLYLSTLRLRI